MVLHGIATGALPHVREDWDQALEEVVRLGSKRVELTSHDTARLDRLVAFNEHVGEKFWKQFEYVSLHLPTPEDGSPEVWKRAVEVSLLLPESFTLVTHPGTLPDDLDIIRPIEHRLGLENMDQRNLVGKTVESMQEVFDRLPSAQFVLDIAHSHFLDPSGVLTRSFADAFSDRLMHVHASIIDETGWHHSPQQEDHGWLQADIEYISQEIDKPLICQWEMLPTWNLSY